MEIKDIIAEKLISLSGKYSPYFIFSDWVELMALTIQNSCYLFNDEIKKSREKQYKSLISKYEKNEIKQFCEMMSLLVKAFEENVDDILGYVYTKSGCYSKETGQFFTPFHLSKLNARLVLNNIDYTKSFTINEPSVGGGGMIIAIAEFLNENGINYQKVMKVTAQDLDYRCVYMCYVQLSLLGIKAKVIQGDTLRNPNVTDKKCIFYTPLFLGGM